MRRDFPVMYECPDGGCIVGGLIYNAAAFVALPFVLLLFLQGSFGNENRIAGVELFYHAFNFFVAASIYRSHLWEYFDDVRYDWRRLMKTVSTSTGLIVLAALVFYFVFAPSENITSLIAYGTLPLSEVELFALCSSTVIIYPVLGTLCMVFLAPVTVSCLYYATIFAPICHKRPLLAYVVMVIFLALPRYFNAATFWNPTEQMILFAAQLPLHLAACWAYHKTDSIWAPILTHMIVNLVSCVMILVTFF